MVMQWGFAVIQQEEFLVVVSEPANDKYNGISLLHQLVMHRTLVI